MKEPLVFYTTTKLKLQSLITMKITPFILLSVCILGLVGCGPSKDEIAALAAQKEKVRLEAAAAEKKRSEENKIREERIAEENRKKEELAKTMLIVVKGKKFSEWQVALSDRDENAVIEALDAVLLLEPREISFLLDALQTIAEKETFTAKTRMVASNMLAVAGKSSYANLILVFDYVLNYSRLCLLNWAFAKGERVQMQKAMDEKRFDRAQQLNERSANSMLEVLKEKRTYIAELTKYKTSAHVRALGKGTYNEFYKRYCEDKKLGDAATKDSEGGFFADFLADLGNP